MATFWASLKHGTFYVKTFYVAAFCSLWNPHLDFSKVRNFDFVLIFLFTTNATLF